MGVKKPREAQKAKALWKMKAAKDAGEEYNDPTHKDFRGRNETRLALWEGHLKDPIVTLDKDADLGGRLALLGSDGQFCVCVCLRTASMEWNVPGKYGPHGELIFFLIQKEVATGRVVRPSAHSSMLTSVHTSSLLMSSRKCALTALHVIAEEGRDGDGCHVPGLGDEWKMG